MKIAINGFFVTKPHTGSGQYVQQLWTALAQLDPLPTPPLEYVLLVPGKAPPDLDSLFPTRPGFTVQQHRLPPGLPVPLAQFWWEQWGLSRAARAAGADLLHCPYL